MGILGPSKKETWGKFAESIGAEVIDNGAFKGGPKVRLSYKNWEVILDTYTVSTGNGSATYTRVRSVYSGNREIIFRVFRTSFLTKIANFFGKKSAKTGDNNFDEEFTVRCSTEDLVKKIFQNEKLKEMLNALKRVNFFVKKAKGKKETKNIEGEYEIHYYMTGVIKDIDTLTLIFGITINFLDEFILNGIAENKAPKISYL